MAPHTTYGGVPPKPVDFRGYSNAAQIQVKYHPEGEYKMSRRESKLGVKLAGGLEGEVTPWAGVSLLVELGRQCGVTETAERVVNEAYGMLPPGPWQIGVRSDSAAYEQGNLDEWDHRGWKLR